VNDIVFSDSSHSLVARFAQDMSKEFEMSMMEELRFFLRLQIKQVNEGTVVHQA
jgi:chemotaxis response regulator CheB